MDTNVDNIKKIAKVIAIFIAVIFMLEKVYAYDCSIADEKQLKQEAALIEIIPNLNDDFNPMHEYYYNVNISNFSDKFKIIDTKENKIYYHSGHTLDSKYGMYIPGEKVAFKIYGAYGGKCSETLLATKTITFSHYNDYYQHEACAGIEEFVLCKRNYSGEIKSEKWFLEKIEEYKKSLAKEKEDKENEKGFFQNILEFMKDNIVVVILLIIVILFIIVFIIVKLVKQKKKIKINLGKGKIK